MPIDRRRYPDNWKEISQRIKARDGNVCRWCGVCNGAVGYRDGDGRFVRLAECKEFAGMVVEIGSCIDGKRIIQIRLTVAHIHDSDPQNCADDNLAALCQKCHNRHDMPMRQRHAARSRAEKKARGIAILPGLTVE